MTVFDEVADPDGWVHPVASECDGVWSTAALSNDGRYRYQLSRHWGTAIQPMLWIMLNPSTADHLRNDPTITRCMGFARTWGQDGIVVRNLYALRATDPRDLASIDEAARVGPHGDEWLIRGIGEPGYADPPGGDPHAEPPTWAPLIVCAWGALSGLGPWAQRRAEHVLDVFAENGLQVHHVGLTAAGRPRHPLYLTRDTRPRLWRDEQQAAMS